MPTENRSTMVSVPEGFMLVERSIWTEQQVEAAAACITRLKGVPGMRDRDLAMAAIDAAQCKAPDIALADLLPAEQHHGDPIMLTAVATLADDGDGGLEPDWLLEGGTAELFAGMTLLVAENAPDLCSEDGSAELYTHPAPADQQEPVAFVDSSCLRNLRVSGFSSFSALLHSDQASMVSPQRVALFTRADPGEVERMAETAAMYSRLRDEANAEVERLRAENSLLRHDIASYLETMAKTCDLLGVDTQAAKNAEGKPSDILFKHAQGLRAQLTEAHALLGRWLDIDLGKSSRAINDLRCKTDYLLSASAEPSAPTCEVCHGNGVIGWRRGQTAESYEEGESTCEECDGTGRSAPVERDERSDYEAACHRRAKSKGRTHEPHYFNRRSSDDTYLNTSAQLGWEIWQVRAALERNR